MSIFVIHVARYNQSAEHKPWSGIPILKKCILENFLPEPRVGASITSAQYM